MPMSPFLAGLRAKIGTGLLLLPTVVVAARDAGGRLLLVQDHGSCQWTLPGGILEPDEMPADAAVREVWEETGLLVRLTRLVGVVGGPGCETRYPNGDHIAWVASVFAAEIDAGTPVADGDETTDARLFGADEVAGLSLRDDCLKFLAAERHSGSAGFFMPSRWQPGP